MFTFFYLKWILESTFNLIVIQISRISNHFRTSPDRAMTEGRLNTQLMFVPFWNSPTVFIAQFSWHSSFTVCRCIRHLSRFVNTICLYMLTKMIAGFWLANPQCISPSLPLEVEWSNTWWNYVQDSSLFSSHPLLALQSAFSMLVCSVSHGRTSFLIRK